MINSICLFWRLCALAITAALLSNQALAQPLYQVKLNDHDLILFGTMHVKPKTSVVAIEAVHWANDSQLLWMEIADHDWQQASQQVMLAAQREQPDLDTQLTPEWHQELDYHWQQLGLTDLPMAQFQGWFISNLLTTQALASLGFHGEYGSEAQLRPLFAERQTRGLETVANQLSLLARLQQHQGEASLIEHTLTSLDQLAADSQALLADWQSADLTAIDQRMRSDLSTEAYQWLLTDRNQQWLELLLAKEFAGQRQFVAVGAAHLAGDSGLLALLVQQGGVVTQLTTAAPNEAPQ